MNNSVRKRLACLIPDTFFGIREMTNENIGTFLAGCITPEFLGNAKGVKWLAAYEKKEGKMTGTWEKAFSLFEQLQKKDLTV